MRRVLRILRPGESRILRRAVDDIEGDAADNKSRAENADNFAWIMRMV